MGGAAGAGAVVDAAEAAACDGPTEDAAADEDTDCCRPGLLPEGPGAAAPVCETTCDGVSLWDGAGKPSEGWPCENDTSDRDRKATASDEGQGESDGHHVCLSERSES